MEIVNELLHSPFLLPALSDTLLCHSILAVSAAMQTNLSDSGQRVLALTLFDQAMSLFRQRVASEALQLDSKTVAAAIYLLHANLSLADDDTLEEHAKSVQVLVDAVGGIENLGMYGAVANLLRWTDVLYSMNMPQTPCRYLLVDNTLEFEDRDSQHGLYWKGNASSIPISDSSVIRACQDCNRMIAFVDMNEAVSTEPVVYFYLCQKVCQLFQQSSEPRARVFQTATVEECVILTIGLLKVLVFMGGWENPHRSDVRRLCSYIVDAIRSTESAEFWRTHTELFIWMVFVVRVAEHESSAQTWSRRVLRGALESSIGPRRSWTNDLQQGLINLLIPFGWSETALLNSVESIYTRLYE